VPASMPNAWDRAEAPVDPDEILDVVQRAKTCVFVRLRRDGHPVGAVVGHNVLDGEIYTITNVLRAAYRSVLRDSRVCAVFDVPGEASVTVVGRGEVVEDPDVLGRFYHKHARGHYMVTSGRVTEDQYLELAFTPQRRLVHIIPETVFSTDLRALPTNG
jgi:general stress protein 26